MSESANPLVAERHDSTHAWTGLGIAEDIIDLTHAYDSGSWIDGTLAGFSTTMDALGLMVDPLGTVVSWGVAWLFEHVKPLSDALDWLAGDPDQITAYAVTWRNVADAVKARADDLGNDAAGTLAGWTGPAADAYRTQAGVLQANLHAAANVSGLIGQIVEGSGLLVALVRGLVRDLIAEFVSILSVRLAEWLAEEACTLGVATPLVMTQVGALVGKWAAKIARVVKALVHSFQKLKPILGRLHELLNLLRATLRYGRIPEAGSPHIRRTIDSQRTSLNGYTRLHSMYDGGQPNYSQINGYLRGEVPASPEIEASIRHLDEAVGIRRTPEDVMVVRETGYSAFNREVNQLPGTTQQDPAFLSTALGNEPTFSPAQPVVLHLNVPAGTPAIYLEGISAFSRERELLLGRNLPYLVDRVERVDGRHHVFGRVVLDQVG